MSEIIENNDKTGMTYYSDKVKLVKEAIKILGEEVYFENCNTVNAATSQFDLVYCNYNDWLGNEEYIQQTVIVCGEQMTIKTTSDKLMTADMVPCSFVFNIPETYAETAKILMAQVLELIQNSDRLGFYKYQFNTFISGITLSDLRTYVILNFARLGFYVAEYRISDNSAFAIEAFSVLDNSPLPKIKIQATLSFIRHQDGSKNCPIIGEILKMSSECNLFTHYKHFSTTVGYNLYDSLARIIGEVIVGE